MDPTNCPRASEDATTVAIVATTTATSTANASTNTTVRTLFLNLHVMFRLVSYVEVFFSLLYSFGSFFLPLC